MRKTRLLSVVFAAAHALVGCGDGEVDAGAAEGAQTGATIGGPIDEGRAVTFEGEVRVAEALDLDPATAPPIPFKVTLDWETRTASYSDADVFTDEARLQILALRCAGCYSLVLDDRGWMRVRIEIRDGMLMEGATIDGKLALAKLTAVDGRAARGD